MVEVTGLGDSLLYDILLKITSADSSKYKYLNRKWQAIGDSEIRQKEEKQLYRHPSSPNTGLFWNKKPISFKMVKISHYDTSNNGNVSFILSNGL